MTQPAPVMRPTKSALPDPAQHSARIMCRCGARDGWAKLDNPWDDDVWVCVHCGGPSYMAEEKRMGMAYFRGGPLDGRAYEVAQLMREQSLAPYIIQYNWTPEITFGPSTGIKARVWQFKESLNEPKRQSAAARSLPPDRPDPGSVPGREGDGMTGRTKAAEGTAVVTDGLRGRREALSASRTDIERLSGMTVPMIARIEKGGPSTTQDEADKYAAALTQLEKNGPKKTAARGRKAAASNGGTPTAEESGDTEGQSAPASDAAQPVTGDVRLHEWNGCTFTQKAKGDMTGGTAVRWKASPSAAFTFVAYTRNPQGHETVELWEVRRRRVRYAKPEDVVPSKQRRRRAS